MADVNLLYKLWCEKATDDKDLSDELKSISNDAERINDRFYRDLAFGTGGLRGVIGAGTNRMNIYTVRKASQGLADYLNANFDNPSCAIAYDSRIKSDLFAKEAARVLAGNGVKVHIYKELMPTPMLSFAVRALKCDAGIVVTASHNPAKYNGYKVYGSDGCQITLNAAELILDCISKIDCFDGIKLADFDKAVADNKISYIGDDVIDQFYQKVEAQSIHPDVVAKSGLKIVYSPLNGAGNKPVREILKRIGITDVVVVPEQENPDGNFPTCPFPNPEIREALQRGLELCKTERPDLLLATDPDCDRVGIAVKNGDEYVLFTGNEVGAMLLEYVAKERIAKGTMPKNPIAVKTIVTTDMAKAIAEEYGVEIIEVLTGFKFIGEQIGFLEEKGEEDRYIFGFEESYGYLSGGYVRDKDAVNGSMLICEMAAFYRANGSSLIEEREKMYKKYGTYFHKQESFTCEGETGMERMSQIMEDLRKNPPKTVADVKVTGMSDYMASKTTSFEDDKVTEIDLPKSDVISFYLEGNGSLIIRPSGTEPKIKIYYTTKASTLDEAADIQSKLSADFSKILGF